MWGNIKVVVRFIAGQKTDPCTCKELQEDRAEGKQVVCWSSPACWCHRRCDLDESAEELAKATA